MFVFDQKWTLVNSFGEEGRGPSEFSFLSNIVFNSDIVGVADDGSKSLKIFDENWKFLKSVRFIYPVSTGVEFVIDENQNIYTHSERAELIQQFNFDGELIDTYGNFYTDFTLETKDRRNIQTNVWHVLLNDDKLYAVNKHEPLILTYDLQSKELIGSYDLSRLNVLQNRLKYTDAQIELNPTENSSYILFWDVNIIDDSIFLLYMNHDTKNNKVLSNEIVQIKVKGENDVEIVNNFLLKTDGWYKTFAVDGNRIITFNRSTASIEEYILPN